MGSPIRRRESNRQLESAWLHWRLISPHSRSENNVPVRFAEPAAIPAPCGARSAAELIEGIETLISLRPQNVKPLSPLRSVTADSIGICVEADTGFNKFATHGKELDQFVRSHVLL